MTKSVQIFIPTYNRVDKLKLAIKSCISQTYGDIEIVVLDNCSTDNTEEYCRSLKQEDDRIKYIKNHENIGFNGNFNRIAGLVNAEFFCFLTDDDTYESIFIEEAINTFKRYPDVSFVITHAPTRINQKIVNSQLALWADGYYTSEKALHLALQGNHPIITNCLFKGFLSHRFIFNEKLGTGSDVYLLISLFLTESVAVSKRVTGYWDIHDNSISMKLNSLKILRSRRAIEKEISKLIKQGNLYLYEEVRFTIADALKNLLLRDNYHNIITHKKKYKYLYKNPKISLIVELLCIKVVYVTFKIILITLRKIKKNMNSINKRQESQIQ